MPKGDRDILKADPEDGTTPIANLLLEGLAISRLTTTERAAVLFLIRCTYGWTNGQGGRHKSAIIDLKQWARYLQIKDICQVSRLLTQLVNKKVIKRELIKVGKPYSYSINTTLDKWVNCINSQLLTEMSRLHLTKSSRLELTELSTPLATNSRLLNKGKEILNKRDISPYKYKKKNLRDVELLVDRNDPEKYWKGKYGHLVRR